LVLAQQIDAADPWQRQRRGMSFIRQRVGYLPTVIVAHKGRMAGRTPFPVCLVDLYQSLSARRPDSVKKP